MMKPVLQLAAVLLITFAANAADLNFTANELGVAQYVNPSSVKLLTDTPTTGITLPLSRYDMVLIVTVDNAPIRYFFGTTNPTTTLGSKLEVGTYYLETKQDIAAKFKFINDSSGSATVSVEYFGK